MIYKTHKQYRLPGYDYSSTGDYFITICTQNRINYFGQITGRDEDAILHLSPVGEIAREFILKIPAVFPMVTLGEWEIMPNHIHLIISVTKDDTLSNNPSETTKEIPETKIPDNKKGLQPLVPGSISSIINHFKGGVKKWCNKNNFSDFAWQSKFHDHIIRNQKSYNNISNYIANNIYSWDEDTMK